MKLAKSNKLIIILILITITILLANSTNAVDINQGVILNTTSSNSSITFSFDIEAKNITINSTHIFITSINFTNSTGFYNCEDINNSVINSNIDSSEFNCTLNTTYTPPTTPEDTNDNSGSSGGSSANYIEIDSENSLNTNIRLYPGRQASLDLENQEKFQEIGISSITIKAKDYLRGEITFNNLKTQPDNCILPDLTDINTDSGEYFTYKIIEINHTFDNDNIDTINLDFTLNNEWIQDNNINNIVAYRCYPETEELDIKLSNQEKSKYQISTNKFSIWVIGGITGDKNQITESETTPKDSTNDSSLNTQSNADDLNENKTYQIFDKTLMEESNADDYIILVFGIILLTILIFFAIIPGRK